MKNYSYTRFLVFLAVFIVFSACEKEEEETKDNKIEPVSTFDFSTSGSTRVNVYGPSYLGGAVFELYTSNPDFGGKFIAKAKLNPQGVFEGDYVLPLSQKELFLKSPYLGLNAKSSPVVTGSVTFDYQEGKRNRSAGKMITPTSVRSSSAVIYDYLGVFDADGFPGYLASTSNVNAQDLSMLQASLPEGVSVMDNNPDFMSLSNANNVRLDNVAEVWVTFLNENTAKRNTIGFYTYKLDSPPNTVEDLDNIKIVFPNASKEGEGGKLRSGDKVRIGAFTPNTGIGWVLFEDGWNGAGVNVNVPKLYSNPNFNTTIGSPKKQSIQLIDEARKKFLVGFEDGIRTGSTDDDFNDVTLMVEVAPWQVVKKNSIPAAIGVADDDGDGVLNSDDDYPNNPLKAFNNYSPYKGGKTTVAFEDLWPFKNGSFDFNDLVIDANYNHITNAANQVASMEYKVHLRTMGASYRNGYGIQWPFDPSRIESISGTNLTRSYIHQLPNGTESGQSKAVMVIFDDAFDNIDREFDLYVKMAVPVDFSQINREGLNPFLIVDGERTREIHLMNKPPTDKINNDYFGMSVDASKPEEGIYYKSNSNLPWGISISHDYTPPKEGVAIHKAYLKFNNWLISDGNEDKDWYENRSGYRNEFNLQ